MTQSLHESPRPLDHLVLPTADLSTARARLAALGFTVAPEGIHPFGTANCCIYFDDGTFMEPLAIGNRLAADKAVAEGNVFVGRDRAFRAAHGEEGFSAVVFATDDADADHAELGKAGVSAGPRLDFSRPFVDATGKSDQVSFRLAFAAEPGSVADAFFFSCQRVNAPNVDRSSLQVHANGVRRIVAVEANARDPFKSAELVARIARSQVEAAASMALEIPLANSRIVVCGSGNTGQTQGLMLESVVFGVDSLVAARTVLDKSEVEYLLDGQRITIPAAPGQGATFIFEEKQ